MADVEYVYILLNPAMPGWIKVGKAKDIQERITELSSKTAVPLPFECYAYMQVPADLVFVAERTLHSFLGISNNKEKEFFQMRPEVAFEYFKSLAPNNPAYKLSELYPLNDTVVEKKKAQNTTFKLLGIPVGSELTYVSDTSITCTVLNEINKVSYNGQEYSVSGLAMELANGAGSINGFTRFCYESETLWERRLRLLQAHPKNGHEPDRS